MGFSILTLNLSGLRGSTGPALPQAQRKLSGALLAIAIQAAQEESPRDFFYLPGDVLQPAPTDLSVESLSGGFQ